jgi:hypothetical protein
MNRTKHVPWIVAVLSLNASAALALAAQNPVAHFGLAWTDQIRWSNVVSIKDFQGGTLEERLNKAQAAVTAQGGGVVFFPAGTYAFQQDIFLKSGVVICGDPPKGVTSAKQDGYDPPTRFEFHRYVPKLEGDGTPIETAFKGIHLEDPAKAENCGIVNVAINRGHIDLGDGTDHAAGSNRIVYGCLLRNAAVAALDVPDRSIGQHAWQRYTRMHHGAIRVCGAKLLIANNRLPRSGDDNFLQKGYVLLDSKRKPFPVDEGVLFDYDNREGIQANNYGLGGAGHDLPDGTPKTHPWGFRKGIVVRDNYVFCTGRGAIEFAGDGVICSLNVIRFPPDVVRWTHTGKHVAKGSSTNGNRAVQMRGWRWTVEGNDYEVYRNRCPEGPWYINDGEGLMHEDHANSTILDSRLIRNKGNSYVSLFACGGINGLVIEGNDIRPGGPGTDTKISSIFCVADRTSIGVRCECRNVSIVNNVTSGSGIRISGKPAANNVVKGNRNVGAQGLIINNAEAVVADNENFAVTEEDMSMPKKRQAKK